MPKLKFSQIERVQRKAARGDKLTMLTAYDFPFASVIDSCGIDMILVGDSLANVVLGLSSTREVGMAEMIHHARAVRRGTREALLIGDMPFAAYQKRPGDAVKNARRFVKEAGCEAVKIEWFEDCLGVANRIVRAGIPVMGHVGLTPQTADRLGGFKVQGKDADSAGRILGQALALEKAGCFAIVLECVPDLLAREISRALTIPTIGIGAGPFCDGQVLVTHDILGMYWTFHPKFAKEYVDVSALIRKGVESFRRDVVTGRFPDKAHSFLMPRDQWRKIKPLVQSSLSLGSVRKKPKSRRALKAKEKVST